jgi:hypothetical protein
MNFERTMRKISDHCGGGHVEIYMAPAWTSREITASVYPTHAIARERAEAKLRAKGVESVGLAELTDAVDSEKQNWLARGSGETIEAALTELWKTVELRFPKKNAA